MNGKAYVLDLNGRTLTTTEDIRHVSFSLVKGSFDLINSSDTEAKIINSNNHGIRIWQDNDSDVVSVSVEKNITISAGDAGIQVFAADKALSGGTDKQTAKNITIKVDGTLVGQYYGININGTILNTEDCPIITLSETASLSGMYGMYLAGYTNTTINGATVTGSSSGIEVRAGSLTVNGGAITSTAENYSQSPNGGGTSVIGAGIAISQHTTKLPINVTINDGTISGARSFVETNVQNEDETTSINMNITNGNFIGELTSDYSSNGDSLDEFITGGTYSTNIEDLVVENIPVTDVSTEASTVYVVGARAINDIVKNASENTTVKVLSGSLEVTATNEKVTVINTEANTSGTVTVNAKTLNPGEETIAIPVAVPEEVDAVKPIPTPTSTTTSTSSTTSGYDDGSPYTYDACGSVYDRWGNKIYEGHACMTQGYRLVQTDAKN